MGLHTDILVSMYVFGAFCLRHVKWNSLRLTLEHRSNGVYLWFGYHCKMGSYLTSTIGYSIRINLCPFSNVLQLRRSGFTSIDSGVYMAYLRFPTQKGLHSFFNFNKNVVLLRHSKTFRSWTKNEKQKTRHFKRIFLTGSRGVSCKGTISGCPIKWGEEEYVVFKGFLFRTGNMNNFM